MTNRQRFWGAPAVYALLALAFTWPLVFKLTTAVPSDIGDPLLNTWILAWDAHALLTRSANLFNANIFYPLPGALAYSEHLFSTALLALPLQLLTAEPVAAYNLSLLLSFPLAAWGMYLLALRWTGRRDAAFIAGLVFGFAPYRLAAIAHLQLLTGHWLPFALLFLDKITTESSPKWRSYAAFGLFLWLQMAASWYLAVYAGLLVGLLTLARWPSLMNAPRSVRTRLLVTLLAVGVFIAPLAAPYLRLLPHLQAARPLELALGLAAAPTDFAAAAPFNRVFGPLTAPFRARPGFTEESWLFVGLVAPALALIGLFWAKPNRRHPAPHSLFLIMVIAGALTLPGPYAALARLFPPATVVRVPPRWIIPALPALAGLAAIGFAALANKLARYKPPFVMRYALFAAITGLLLLEAFSAPIPLAPVENRTTLNPAYGWLAQQPGPTALLELPLHSAPAPEYPEVKRLYAGTLGWWGLVNGYSGYTPPRQPQLAAALAHFPAAESVAALQNLLGEIRQSPLAAPDAPLFLLVHPDEAPLSRARWEAADRWLAERNPALRPVGRFNGSELWAVQPAAPNRWAGPPLAEFGPAGAIRLLEAVVLPNPPRLALYWTATTPPATDVTVFVHLCAADGFVRGQADGPPVSGHYPAPAWQPGEVVQDIHPLPPDFNQADHLAVGLYRPGGERLPARAAAGAPLPDNAVIMALPPVAPAAGF